MIDRAAPFYTDAPVRRDRLHLPGMLDINKIWPEMSSERREATRPYPLRSSEVAAYNQAVEREVFGGIAAQEFMGRAALRAVAALEWEPQVYHGTRAPRELLLGGLAARQATWGDAEGRRYRDGQPATCFAEDPDVALVMALFSPRHKGMEGTYLAYGCDVNDRHWFVGQRSALEKLPDRVRVVTANISLTEPYPAADSNLPPRQGERRSHRVVTPYTHIIEASPADVPPSMLLVDSDMTATQEVWRRILQGEHPLDIAPQIGVAIDTYSGQWDVQDHHNVRHHPTRLTIDKPG